MREFLHHYGLWAAFLIALLENDVSFITPWAMRFRRHSIEQLHRMAPHWHDESALLSIGRAGRLQLEQLFAQERAARAPAEPVREEIGGGTPAFDMPPPAPAGTTVASGRETEPGPDKPVTR